MEKGRCFKLKLVAYIMSPITVGKDEKQHISTLLASHIWSGKTYICDLTCRIVFPESRSMARSSSQSFRIYKLCKGGPIWVPFIQSIVANFYRYPEHYTATPNGRTTKIAIDVNNEAV